MYRTALVGCGARARAHARAYEHVGAGQVVACCDLNAPLLHAFADQLGIEGRYTDVEAMLAEVRPDLVHVVTPPAVRASAIQVILRHPPRGILLEKPLAMRPSEGYDILASCADAGVALFVNHQMRHHRSWQKLRALVQEGAVGPIRFARASCLGNLMEEGTHLFDLVSLLAGDDPGSEAGPGSGGGEPAWWLVAQATGAAGYLGGHRAPSYTAGVLALAAGWHVSFECGGNAPRWPGDENYWLQLGVEVYGEDGRAGCSLNHGWWLHTAQGTDGEAIAFEHEDLLAQARLTESVLLALDDPAQHPNNARRSRISFDLVMAAQRAALRRARVVAGETVQDQDVERLRSALAQAEIER